MSCRCEHIKMNAEYDRIKRLAKSYAEIEQKSVAIYGKDGGGYDFCAVNEIGDKQIIEIISRY